VPSRSDPYICVRVDDGTITILSSLMLVLLVDRPRRRLAHGASFRHSQATVFHHARSPPRAVGAVAVTVI
jgi:hypothetical protein